jgi:hypothetical protein
MAVLPAGCGPVYSRPPPSPAGRQGSTQSPFFLEIRTPESIGLLGPTELDSSVDLGSWVKKNRTLPWTRTPGSKANWTRPWTRTRGSTANRTLPWTRTLGPAPGRTLVWTRTLGLVGLGVWRSGSATSQPALGLGKSNPLHKGGGGAGEVNGLTPPWLLIIQT